MYLRDVKQLFKPNNNFTQNRGFLYCYLENDIMKIKVINILKKQDEEDKKLKLYQLYQKYRHLIENDYSYSIMEYFELDENGIDVQYDHFPIVESELKQIKEQIEKKQVKKENVEITK